MSATINTPRTTKAWANMHMTPSDLMRLSERLEIELGVANARWSRLKCILMQLNRWDVVATLEAIEEEVK